MEVVPVIDVALGKAVRGIKGDRASYRPIVTPLCEGSAPAAVASALMRTCMFRKLYVADLDGIEGRGRNVHLVPSLSAALGPCEIWLDAGVASPHAARAVLAAPVAVLVVGSESVESVEEYYSILADHPQRTVLSLDFRGDEFMGPRQLLDDPDLWPDRIIVMTLARVGSDAGPDLKRIGEVMGRAAGRKIYAAGGIRDRADLEAVRASGAAGVLVASALHAGRITPKDIKAVSRR